MIKENIIYHGFVHEEPTPDNYILGAFTKLPKVVRVPDGQWIKHLAQFQFKHEQQKKNFETYNCTGFGATNDVELYLSVVFKVHKNLSDSFLGTIAGTWPPGNSMQKPMEMIRKEGVVTEEKMPWAESIDTLEKYYDKGKAENLKTEAKKFLSEWDYGHEWVFYGNETIEQKQALLKKALQYSPVGVSVLAWREDTDRGLYVKEPGEIDTHRCVLVGYDEGKCWYILDSYFPHIKKLAWEYPFGQAKRIYMSKRVPKPSLWDKIVSWFQSFFDKGALGAARSPSWRQVRNSFVKENPECAVCGKRKIDAHHLSPFQFHPELELEKSNLISLCRDHHLLVGHLMNFRSYNEHCAEDTKIWRDKIAQRP